MAKHVSRWTGKEFHYDQFDQIANENAYRSAEAFDRDFVANLERINGRPLTRDEKIMGFVKRKDTRSLIEKSKADIWQPVKAKNNSPTAKYDNLIASLNNDQEARYLEAAKIKDFRQRTVAFAEIERDKMLAAQAEQAASAELKESKGLQQLKEWREEIRFNGNVDEKEWSAIDRAIRQAEFVGGCELETAALFEDAKAIREERITLHNYAIQNQVAALQAQIQEIKGEAPAAVENPYTGRNAYYPPTEGLTEVQEALANE